MGTCVFRMLSCLVAWVVAMVVISRMTPRTRSSMRLRDSFQANRERKIVLCGWSIMLSVRRERICEGL